MSTQEKNRTREQRKRRNQKEATQKETQKTQRTNKQDEEKGRPQNISNPNNTKEERGTERRQDFQQGQQERQNQRNHQEQQGEQERQDQQVKQDQRGRQEEGKKGSTQTSHFDIKAQHTRQQGREDQPLSHLGDNQTNQQDREDYKGQDEFLDNEQDFERANRGERLERNEDEEVRRRWEDVREDFMLRHDGLDDVDVTYGEQPGDFDAMLGRLQEKTGKSKEELREEILLWEVKSRR